MSQPDSGPPRQGTSIRSCGGSPTGRHCGRRRASGGRAGASEDRRPRAGPARSGSTRRPGRTTRARCATDAGRAHRGRGRDCGHPAARPLRARSHPRRRRRGAPARRPRSCRCPRGARWASRACAPWQPSVFAAPSEHVGEHRRVAVDPHRFELALGDFQPSSVRRKRSVSRPASVNSGPPSAEFSTCWDCGLRTATSKISSRSLMAQDAAGASPSWGMTCCPKRSISAGGSSRQTIRPSRPSMSS